MQVSLLIWLVAELSVGYCIYYELEGHFSNLTYSIVTPGRGNFAANHAAIKEISQQLSSSLNEDLSDFYVNDFEIHGIDAGIPTVIFHGFLTTSSPLSRQQLIEQITLNGNVKLYYFAKVGSLPSLPPLEEDSATDFTCYNGGILLPNNTCVCPSFTSGSHCEVISCLHSGILDENRCTCPPGAYALNCEPRGCLPGVKANLDTSLQSFILVINLRSTMAFDISVLITQMPTWIKDIDAAAKGLLDNFIVTTYLQCQESYYMHSEIFATSESMIDYLNGLVISAGDADQPTIAAINSAQSYSSAMHPASVVYVFADSPDSSATPYNPKLSSNTMELQTVQRMLAWRNKLVLLLSATGSSPLDYYGDQFDIYRRVVKATQGDLIVCDKTEITNVISQLLIYFYQMENSAALYGVDPFNEIEITVSADYPTQIVYILVSCENTTAPSLLDQNGALKAATSGNYYKLFVTSVDQSTAVVVSAKKSSSANVRIWFNSPNTAFLASNPDPTVDVGSVVSISELSSYSTAYVAGLAAISAISLTTYDMVGTPLGQLLVGNLNRSAECTYPYSFPPMSCTAGPYVQKLTAWNGTATMNRLIPGFCAEPDHPTPVPFSCYNGGTKASTGTCRCTAQFTGRNCATPVCLNGGTVEKFPGNGRTLCHCPGGYGGNHCETLSCNSTSTNVFGSVKRTLAVVIQNSYSQAEQNSHINSGLGALLRFMGQADAFDEYIVCTFNTVTMQNQPFERVFVSPYSSVSAFLNATASAAIGYQNSQSSSQPSIDALWQTIMSTSHDKSSIFLFTDSPPTSNDTNTDFPNVVLTAVERELQINVIITPPFQSTMTNQLCMLSSDASIYSQLALETGGTVINLCQTYTNTYPRDIITEFFTGYGITHHHVETLQEVLISDCSALTMTQFYIDDPSTQVYAFVNSDQVEGFTVGVSDNDNAQMYTLPSQVQMPFFGIYQINPNLYNRYGYTLQVQSDTNSVKGSCSVRIVEKTQLAVYLGFTPDPSEDSPSLTLTYGSVANPVVHMTSQLQADVKPNILVLNSDETVRYNATATRRLPSCRYESFFSTPFACSSPYGYFLATITIQTEDATVQRTKRAYCYLDPGVCLNGGMTNLDGSCKCGSDYTGEKCENPICRNGGTREDFKCVCAPGYNGLFCQYIACQEWNYVETHDLRQQEFRQITFVVERNLAMVLPTIYLQQMISDFVTATESNDVPKQYSLITFDENVVTNIISTSHTKQFVATFIDTLNDFTNSDPTTTLGGDALQEAYKITIQPPSVIFLFAAHFFTRFPATYAKQRLGTQVNFFFMERQDYPQPPSNSIYPAMMARQSGGRLLPLTLGAAKNFLPLLTSIVKENALLYDDGFKDCSSPQTVTFHVESRATRVVLDITGIDVSVADAVSVMDGQGANLTVNTAAALMSDTAALVVDFALKPWGPFAGQWTVTIKTTSGSCFIQARTESPVHVIPGFSSSRDVDFVKSGPFSSFGTDKSVYVAARITNWLSDNLGATLDSLSIDEADFSAPWQDKRLVGQSIHVRDPTGCSSQFVTEMFASPTTTYQKYTIMGTDAMNVKFQRTFFFTLPSKTDSAPQCVSGTRNQYGECECDNKHSGDYCSDRVCLNGGTSSLGTCVCMNGFYGDFCENALSDATTSSSTAKSGVSFSTDMSPLTTSSSPPNTREPTSTVMPSPVVSSSTHPASSLQSTTVNAPLTSTQIMSSSAVSPATTATGTTGEAPVCFPQTTTFMISFLLDASLGSPTFVDSQENLMISVAKRFGLGNELQQTSFLVAGMAESYIAGAWAASTDEINASVNNIVENDSYGQMTLNVGKSLEGFQNSTDSDIRCCGPDFVIVLMGQQSKDSIQNGYSSLYNRGYELLAIDMTNSGSVAPSLIPVFDSKNVKSYTTDMTADTMAAWIQDRLCRIKYSEPSDL